MQPMPAKVVSHRTILYALAFAGFILFAGLLAADYRAGFVFLFGMVLAWLPIALVWYRRTLARHGRIIFAGLLVLLLMTCLLSFFATASFRAAPNPGMECTQADVQGYRVVFQLLEPSADRFTSTEDADVVIKSISCYNPTPAAPLTPNGPMTVPATSRPVTAKDRGFLLKEVQFAPLQTLSLPNGQAPRIAGAAVNANIVLRDFPKNSFYTARNMSNIRVDTLGDIATISWTQTDLSDGIDFAYIPSPFNLLLPIVSPFIGLSNAGEFVVALAGLAWSLLFSPIVGVALYEIARDRFKSRLVRTKKAPDTNSEE